jgi:DNA-binding NarL/FixJ family response regulator
MFTEPTEPNELSKLYSHPAGTGDVIHVVVVDSREAMREGLRQMLSSDDNIRVIGEARDEKEALVQVQKLCPEIVILDIATAMRGTYGISLISQLKQATQHMGIILLSDGADSLVPAIENGASGFLTRDISRNELITAVRLAHLWRLILFQDEKHFTLVRL